MQSDYIHNYSNGNGPLTPVSEWQPAYYFDEKPGMIAPPHQTLTNGFLTTNDMQYAETLTMNGFDPPPMKHSVPQLTTDSSFGSDGTAGYGDAALVETLRDLTYVIDPTGNVTYCSAAITDTFGYHKNEILGQGIASILHPEDVQGYADAFNASIITMRDFSHYHRLKCRDGEFVLVETLGRPIYDEGRLSIDSQGNTMPMCKCLMMSTRPYPSRAAMSAGEFYELKTEQDQLRLDLRANGMNEVDTDMRLKQPKQRLNMFDRRNSAIGAESPFADPAETLQRMLAEAQERPMLAPALTDGSPFYEVPIGHVQPSPATRKKPRRVKSDQEALVCADCRTTDSPEWRKGPLGAKSLCNACGLRYAKRIRKSEPRLTRPAGLERDSSGDSIKS